MNLNKLINKGLLTVYGPLVSFVVICVFIAHWVAKNILHAEKVDFIVLVSLFVAIGIGWIWWSYKIVKWKCWAFSQVGITESRKLYQKALEVGLIWPVGSVFNKTEIWTAKDKRKWKDINPGIRKIFE